MAKMLATKVFCTYEPHLEGKEVFGSQKYKTEFHLGFGYKSHRPNIMNFSHLPISTRSTRVRGGNCSLNDILEELSLDM